MKVLPLLLLAVSMTSARSEPPVATELASGPDAVEIRVGKDGTAHISCQRPVDCSNAPTELVCGSDGVTYGSHCAFVTAFCATPVHDMLLFIRSMGPCAPDKEVLRNMGEDEPEDSYCSLKCRMKSDPVCGSDGVTYLNDCHLVASKCEFPTLEKASHGKCKDDSVVPELQFLEFDMEVTDAPHSQDEQAQEEAIEAPSTIVAKCNPICERVYDAVCGSDGITYANACLLDYARCQNPSVKLFGAGKCPASMRAARDGDGGLSGQNNVNTAASCVPGPCASTYAPVCGSDGHTYDNLCLFANARCQDPKRALTVVHDGECDADTELTCDNLTCPTFTACHEQTERDGRIVAYCADVCSPDRCGEREDCELLDSDCFTAPCSPVATCVPKVQEQ